MNLQRNSNQTKLISFCLPVTIIVLIDVSFCSICWNICQTAIYNFYDSKYSDILNWILFNGNICLSIFTTQELYGTLNCILNLFLYNNIWHITSFIYTIASFESLTTNCLFADLAEILIGGTFMLMKFSRHIVNWFFEYKYRYRPSKIPLLHPSLFNNYNC